MVLKDVRELADVEAKGEEEISVGSKLV